MSLLRIDRQIKDDQDDTEIIGGAWSNNNPYPYFGKVYNTPGGISLRFEDITIPPGSEVKYCHISLHCPKDSYWIGCATLISAEKSADPAKITSYADFLGRPRTDTKHSWIPDDRWFKGSTYRSHWLQLIVAELIGAFDYYQAHMQFFFEDDDSPHNMYRYVASYKTAVSAAAILYLTFDPPPSSQTYVPPIQICTIENQAKCWERWGDTLMDNNPWYIWRDHLPYSLTLADGLLTFSKDFYQNMVQCRFETGKWPIRNSAGQHLYFNGRCTQTTGDDHYHFITYHIRMKKDVEYRIIEPLISRGDYWGPVPMPHQGDELKSVFDYGLGPEAFDVYEEWLWGRRNAGQDEDPDGWYVYMVDIALEEIAPAGFMEVVNDFVHLAYDLAPLPTPPSPIKNWLIITKTHIWTPSGKIIYVTTDVPCHLRLRRGEEPPVRHERVTLRRGVADYGDPHLGFDAWTEIDQQEIGDTYLHTFIIDPWPAELEMTYYFVGSILGGDTKSRSPFFYQIRGDSLWNLLFYEPWGVFPPDPLPDPPPWRLLFNEPWDSPPQDPSTDPPYHRRLFYEAWEAPPSP